MWCRKFSARRVELWIVRIMHRSVNKGSLILKLALLSLTVIVFLFLSVNFSLRLVNSNDKGCGGLIICRLNWQHSNEPPKQRIKNTSLKIENNHVVHVLFLTDSNFECAPLPNLINSILLNTKSTVQFHISLCNISAEKILSCLKCYLIPNLQLDRVNLHKFDKKLLQAFPLVEEYAKLPKKNQRHYGLGESCGLWSRFFIPKLLPSVERVVYLDTDVIVQGDIADLDRAAAVLNTPLVVTKPFNYVTDFSNVFPLDVKTIFETHHPDTQLNMTSPAFIAGVLMMNLALWRQHYDIIMDNMNFWMEVAIRTNTTADDFRPVVSAVTGRYSTKPNNWWEVPDQSLTYLAFYQFTSYIHRPNVQCDSLTWISVPADAVHSCAVLHWNGAGKPWLMSGRRGYSNLWREYSPVECSGDGRCILVNSSLYTCKQDAFIRSAVGIYL